MMIFSWLLVGCGESTNTTTETETTTEEAQAEPAQAPAKKYTITAFSPSQAYPDAAIESVSYKDGKFNFQLKDGEYKLGNQTPDAEQKMCANSGKGQHIHLIANDSPYAAKYTNEFEHE